jgi:hypothetical protein
VCSVRSAPLLVPCLPHTIEFSQYVKSMLLLIVLLLTMPLPPTITMCFLPLAFCGTIRFEVAFQARGPHALVSEAIAIATWRNQWQRRGGACAAHRRDAWDRVGIPGEYAAAAPNCSILSD